MSSKMRAKIIWLLIGNDALACLANLLGYMGPPLPMRYQPLREALGVH